MKKLLLIVAALCLLPISAHAVEQVTGVGFSIDVDGGLADNFAYTGVRIPLPNKMFMVTDFKYSRTIDPDEQDFGMRAAFGYSFSKYFDFWGGIGGMKDEMTGEEYLDFTAHATFFPLGNSMSDAPMKYGFTPFVVYRPGQDNVWGGLVFTTFIGSR